MINKKHLCKACALILSIAMILSMTVSVLADSKYVIFVNYSGNAIGYIQVEENTAIGDALLEASSGYHWEDANGNVVDSATVVGTDTLYVYEVADTGTATEEYFTINGVNFGGGSSYYNASTQTVVLGTNGWGDCIGWWFGSSSTLNFESFTITFEKSASAYSQLQIIYTDDSVTSVGFGSWSGTSITATCEDKCIKQIYLQSGTESSLTITNVSYTVRSTSTPEEVETETKISGVIYVNEEYHALLINGAFISIPHTDDNGDGYCDVCNEYIGTDEESSELVSEDVEVNEPVEEGDTKTEDDEDVDVGDDVDETPAEESNPTTGVVIALVPMAIAGLAFVSSKRK